ncbi:hypothetical protein [Paracoccus sp. (in: a-proteobacteria)]|uniref:hypothetical protein n=1 Tax=Paracoccus sp. TaxID=267 RepID=UPI00396CAFDA
MHARAISALRLLRLSIVLIGLLQLGAFAPAPKDLLSRDHQGAGQTPAQLLYAARPAQVAILAAKLTAIGPTEPPSAAPPPILAAEATAARMPLRSHWQQYADHSRSLPRQLVLHQQRARGPPLA